MCVENSAKRSDRRASLILVVRSSGNVCSVQKNQNNNRTATWCLVRLAVFTSPNEEVRGMPRTYLRTQPKEGFMKLNMQRSHAFAGAMFLLLSVVPNNLIPLTAVASAQQSPSHCVPVSGALMTNIGAIAGVTNLGPASGDLAGSLAATILGQNSNGTYNVQHYWVTSAGETITLKKAVLTPTYPTGDPGIVAVPWGNYRSYISGGTGKFEGATGYLDYFGMADFYQNTLVLRYRGQVCYAH